MKKIYLLMLTVFLNFAFFSCTPTSIVEGSSQATEECCDEDGDIDPPPPPPDDGD